MTKLVGTGGIDVTLFRAQSKALTTEFEAEDRVFKALDRMRQAPTPEAKLQGASSAPKSSVSKLMEKESARGDALIDWGRFEALRSATPAVLEDAVRRFRALDRLDLDFQKVVQSLAYLGQGIDLESLPTADARRHYADRVGMKELLARVKQGLVAAGDSPATARFPHDQLALLARAVDDDLKALVRVKGEEITKPSLDRATSYGWGGPSMAPMNAEPSPDMLPATKALGPKHVATLDAAAHALAERLHAPELAAQLTAVGGRLDAAGKKELGQLLGAYAILADEAVHAPDYASDPFRSGPDHRQKYRAREHSGGWGAKNDAARQTASRAALAAPLRALAGADAPLKSLERALVQQSLRELGVSAAASAHWAPKTAAVVQMLEGEGFLPLRALNERAHHHAVPHVAEEMRGVVRDITRAVVEGRFEEWRASHPASEVQLSVLTEAQRKVWLEDLSIDHEVKTKDGKSVTLTTSQPRDMERFWATKVGGPSHGFDTMTQCAVPLLTNARNDTIVVSDPRWPNHAGRTYLRLVQLAKTEEPVLFLESSHRDFPYPGSQLETESAIIKHALAKAKKMGIPLVLSGRCERTIQHLGLAGQWRQEQYRLAPSLLYEAASVFGPHDWVQKHPHVAGASSIQFYVTP